MRRKDREITEIADIEDIISRSDVCRISFADNNVPYMVTMNFGYTAGASRCLWFHCASAGRKLDLIRRNNYVCFEMDTDHQLYDGTDGCDWGMKFSSVVGYGSIVIVEEEAARMAGIGAIMSHYTGRDNFSYNEAVLRNTTVLRLDIEAMTGKRKH
jgi:nitroimidazol reductase NimA-like FMN-containing flavoprotein (pyridoxamine 5'-phosphate oxidase superfamily)